jgi:hypothetical protein
MEREAGIACGHKLVQGATLLSLFPTASFLVGLILLGLIRLSEAGSGALALCSHSHLCSHGVPLFTLSSHCLLAPHPHPIPPHSQPLTVTFVGVGTLPVHVTPGTMPVC